MQSRQTLSRRWKLATRLIVESGVRVDATEDQSVQAVMDQSDIFADDSEMNYDSPPPSTNKPRETPGPKDSRFQDDEAHEVALKQELESIRKINRVVEGVVDSLEKAKGNMEV